MMGEKAEQMTQEDIDKAIEYLFPSGLYEKSARPLMKPPEEIFPKQKDAEFDAEGRPFDPFFYTAQPHYTRAMHDIVALLDQVNAFNDKMHKQGKKPDPDQMLNDQRLSGTRWMTKAELEGVMLEKIMEKQYDELISVFERLTFQHFSYQFKDVIFKYRVDTAKLKSSSEFIQPEFNEEGNAFVEALGQRKTSCAKVRVTKPGTGKFRLVHMDHPDVANDITYFFSMKDRTQVMYPLQFTKLLGIVDVDVMVDAGGSDSQAGAIRYATSVCLKTFVDSETIEQMTMAGLLTQDLRVRERKKPGQEGARRKFTWKKR
jgi:small subunit ribosomal protein S9